MTYEGELPVDAGIMAVASIAWIEKMGGKIPEDAFLCRILPEAGNFAVKLEVSGWSNNTDTGSVSAEKGLYVGDLGYALGDTDEWGALLEKTNYLTRSVDGDFVVVSTGGDGMISYTADIETVVKDQDRT